MSKPAAVFFAFVILFSVFSATGGKADDKADVQAALKEAGVSALPVFLDAATENIKITFPKVMGGGTLTFGGTIDAEALAEKKFVFTTSDEHKLTWNDAFGMPFLDLTDVALSLRIEKGAFAVSLDGMASGAFRKGHQPREVVIDLSIEEGKLADFTLSLPDANLSLHDIPAFKNLPGVSKFAIEGPTVSLGAIGGKVDFLKEKVDAVAFYDADKKDWNLGLRFQKPLTLAALTGHDGGFLKHLGLPKMQVLISTKGLEKAYEDLPLAAQNFFAAVYGNLPEGTLNLEDGVNLRAVFDPALAPASIKKPLDSLGLGTASLEIDGTVEGLFGSEPSVALAVHIDEPKDHGFTFLKTKGAEAEFFIELSKAAVGLGFRTAVTMSQGKGKPDLEFDVDFGLKENGTEVEVQVAGAMKGNWVDAAHIKGLTLENPFLSVGINESGSFDMLLDGTVKVGSETIRATADLVLSPEALGLPTAVALAGEVNKLSFNDFATHSKKFSPHKGGGFKKLDVEFKDLAFAFMTPGAQLPPDLEEALSLEGAGMAISGTLVVHGKELGSVKGHGSTEGISIDGTLAPFKLGPLDLKDAELAIQAGPSVSPKFAMSGDIALFKGFEESYSLDLEPHAFSFTTDTKFGGAFEAELAAHSDGLSFKSGNDFSFEAQLAAKYNDVFKDLVQGALKALKKGEKDIKATEKKVQTAEKKVSGLKKKIDAAKKDAKKHYDAAKNKINKAEAKVTSLNRTISNNKKKAHDLDKKAKKDAKKLKLSKAAKEGTELAAVKSAIAAEETALKTAKWALETAKKSVDVVPVDAAPEVLALQTELGAAEAALQSAQGVLEAVRAADVGVEKAVAAIGKGVTALKINKLGASGSILGITSGGKQGDEPTLIINVTIHGKHHVYRESIGSVKDEFRKLANGIAKEVAKAVLDAFTK